MKTTRRLLALITVLALILALGTTAFAEDPVKNDSITVTSAKVGETYNLYKMFDLIVNDEFAPTSYSYTVNSAWVDFFKAADAENDVPAGPGNQYITVNEAGYVTAISDAAALAKTAAAWSGKPTATQSIEADGTTVVFQGLADGYWLITSTLGTEAMIQTTPDDEDVTINEKNPENTIEKTVKEDSANTYGETNDAQIGDTVEFKSTVKIVKGTRNVVVHDEMDSGLTYTAGSVAIEGLTKDTEYTVNEAPTDGDTFDITFTQSWIDGLDFGDAGYKEYVITYTATLNENAVVSGADGIAIVDQENKTTVSFGDATTSIADSTSTTTHKFEIFKHAKGSDANLADAVFQLKKDGTVVNLIMIDANNYRVAKTGETGAVTTFTTVSEVNIVIWGVDKDSDYTLAETAAPAGYNILTEEVNVTWEDNNDTVVDVENNSGSVLPSTGGMGTTIFYLLGGLMVLSALVVLVTNKRMRAN